MEDVLVDESTRAKKTPKAKKEPKVKAPVKELRGEFTREFKDGDGITRTWFYNTDKYGMNPYKVEINYPEGYEHEGLAEDDNTLPKTKRKYLNPENGKMVGYTRGRMLGLID